MVIKILLLLPLLFLPGVLMHGVVKDLGVVINGDEIPFHTWYQEDPVHSKVILLYKLECSIAKNVKDLFVVKIYYQEKLLDILTVSRFDDEMLKSITVLRRDKQDRHRIRYRMAKGTGAPCKLRLYEPNKGKGFTPTEVPCGSWFVRKIWSGEGKGWKWDVDAITDTPPRGVVGQTGLLKFKDTGELLHTWSHKMRGYKMAVRRIKAPSGDTYLATVMYRGAVMDIVEVHSLGEGLTRSITIMGQEKDAQVVQYYKTDEHCQRLNYKMAVGRKDTKTMVRATTNRNEDRTQTENANTADKSRPGQRTATKKRHHAAAQTQSNWATRNEEETESKPTAIAKRVGIVHRTTDRLEYKDVTQPPIPLKCKMPLLKTFSFVFKKIFMVKDSGNGWIW